MNGIMFGDNTARQSFINLLKGQGITVECEISGKTIIASYKGDWWTVHDNGSELNFEKINTTEFRAVGFTSNLTTIDTMTMVYRALRVFKHEAIDYSFCANIGIVIERVTA